MHTQVSQGDHHVTSIKMIDPDGTHITRNERPDTKFNSRWIKYFTDDDKCEYHRSDGPAVAHFFKNTKLVSQELFYLNGDPWSHNDHPFERQYDLEFQEGEATRYLSGVCWFNGDGYYREYKPAVLHYEIDGSIKFAEYYKNYIDITVEVEVMIASGIIPGTKEWEFTWDLL